MSTSTINKKWFFYGVFFLSIFGVIFVLKDSLSVLASSLIYSAIIYPLYKFMRRKWNLGPSIASALTILTSFTTLVLPIYFVLQIVIVELIKLREVVNINLIQNPTDMMHLTRSLNQFLSVIPGSVTVTQGQIQASLGELIKPVSSFLLNQLFNSATYIGNLIIFVFLVFLLLPQLKIIRSYLEKISPFDDDVDETYINRVISMTKTMVYGTFIVAIAQGILAGLFMWFAGVQYVLTLSLIAVLASLIPVLGTGFVTIPVSLVLMFTGHVIPAIIILTGQLFVVSSVDNIIRSYLVRKSSTTLHPILLLLGFFGGIQAFGPLGIIYGPVIMILFVTSIELYLKKYA